MMSEKTIYDFLEDETFRRYVLNGDFSDKWEKWQVDNPGLKSEFELAFMLLRKMHRENEQIIGNLDKRNIKNKIKASLFNKIDGPKIIKGPVYWKLVAVLLVLLVSIPIILHLNDKLSSQEDVKITDVQKIIRQNPPGIRSVMTFSDGSKVHLNAGSTLIYPNTFLKEKREVELIGEGYFEIAHDETRPFIVHASGLGVNVLGTSFNIDAYPENQYINVALVSGKVSVNTISGEAVMLSPSQLLNYSLEGDKVVKIASFVAEDIIGWKDGILSFRDETINDIFKKLERWYVVNIIYDENNPVFSEWVFTGKFNNRSLEYILNTINHQDIFEFTIEKDKIIIK
jgi:transmembrane sensor